MPNIGEGREFLQANIPIGYRDKLDQMLEEGKRRFPEMRAVFQDRGTLLGWLIDRAWFIKEMSDRLAAELDRRRNELLKYEDEIKARLREREEELNEYREELEKRHRQLSEAESKLCEQLGMLPYAKELWFDLIQSKIVSKDEILTTLKTLKEAGINLAEVVKVIQEENLPGFIGWVRKVKDACIQASDTLAKLKEDIASHKMALEQLQQAEKELITKINTEIDKYDRAVMEVSRVCAAARDVGLYIDYIKQSCRSQGADRIQDLLPEPALVIAGTILEAVAAAYGDREVTIAPGPKHLFPVQVTLRELARSLAPVDAYREQQKAQMKVEVMAESIAASG